MFLLRILLFPLAVLYDAVTRLRNLLFDIGMKPAASFDVPLISVGNLVVGGTGKTPMVEHIVRLLIANNYSMATLSRGYGRSTKGMRIANAGDTADTIGDEPFQLFQKFNEKAVVSVCEERAFAIPHLVDQFPDTQAIILDDAFQHRFVKPGLSILLTEYSNPFYNDYVLPSGYLREARRGSERSDLVVVTKCPENIGEEKMMKMEHAIRKYADRPVFFSTIRYGDPLSFTQDTLETDTKKIVLVSGIANHKPLENYLTKGYTLVKHYAFNDHHHYTSAEVNSVIAKAKESGAIILTTEKDKAKLDVLLTESQRKDFFYVPIEVTFIKSGSDFDTLVLNYVKQAQASIKD